MSSKVLFLCAIRESSTKGARREASRYKKIAVSEGVASSFSGGAIRAKTADACVTPLLIASARGADDVTHKISEPLAHLNSRCHAAKRLPGRRAVMCGIEGCAWHSRIAKMGFIPQRFRQHAATVDVCIVERAVKTPNCRRL